MTDPSIQTRRWDMFFVNKEEGLPNCESNCTSRPEGETNGLWDCESIYTSKLKGWRCRNTHNRKIAKSHLGTEETETWRFWNHVFNNCHTWNSAKITRVIVEDIRDSKNIDIAQITIVLESSRLLRKILEIWKDLILSNSIYQMWTWKYML